MPAAPPEIVVTTAPIIIPIVVGFFIFVLGQAFLKLVIEPAQELKKAIGLVSSTLLYNQAVITNNESSKEISDALRLCSADIVSKSYVVLGYHIAKIIFRLPLKSDIVLAAQELNDLSYAVRGLGPGFNSRNEASLSPVIEKKGVHNTKSIKHISKLLNIKTSYSALK